MNFKVVGTVISLQIWKEKLIICQKKRVFSSTSWKWEWMWVLVEVRPSNWNRSRSMAGGVFIGRSWSTFSVVRQKDATKHFSHVLNEKWNASSNNNVFEGNFLNSQRRDIWNFETWLNLASCDLLKCRTDSSKEECIRFIYSTHGSCFKRL